MGRYVEIHGTHAVIVLLAHSRRRREAWLKEVIVDLAEHATAQQRVYAPHGETGYLHEHIGRSGILYSPGGPGGGGSYRVVSGVRRGSSDHPLYVHGGTANLDDSALDAAVMAGGNTQGRIYPKGGAARGIASVLETRRTRARWKTHPDSARRPALTFHKRGEPRKFRAWVSGQRPQPFAYFAFVSTSVYAKGRIRTIASVFG